MTRALTVEAEPAFRTRHANPYNASLYRAMQGLGVRVRDLSYVRLAVTRVDIVHLHWPSLTFLSGHRQWRVFARLVCFFGALRVARLRGTRVVWTVHNVEAHEQRSTPRLRSWYRRLLLANVDGILALTNDGVDAARRAHPELAAVPAFVTPHGHYRDDYDFSIGRDAARERLALPDAATVVLTVGQVRPYKNVPHLIRTFADVHEAAAVLAIAGRPSTPALAEEIRDAAAPDPRVVTELEFQADDRLAHWLVASDLVVLPYTAIQNSGSAILALSANRPVLVPAIGGMVELADLVGPEWIRTYDGTLEAVDLARAIAWARAPRAAPADLSALDWSNIARDTVAAYHQIRSGRAPAQLQHDPIGEVR